MLVYTHSGSSSMTPRTYSLLWLQVSARLAATWHAPVEGPQEASLPRPKAREAQTADSHICLRGLISVRTAKTRGIRAWRVERELEQCPRPAPLRLPRPWITTGYECRPAAPPPAS